MKTGFATSATLVLAGVLIGSIARADTTIHFTNADGDGSETGTTEIADGKMRMSTPEGDGFMIFDAASGEFVAVNNADRSYMVFDEQTVEKLANMQNQVMKQMEAQLAQLPASQREQMRAMMKSMMPQMPEAPPERRYDRTGASRSVAGFDCEVLVVYAGDKKISEQCVADRDDLDIPDDDYQTVRAMQQFVEKLTSSFAQMSDQAVDFGQPGYDEVPVEYVHYSRFGESRGHLSKISNDDIDPARFVVPEGYKAQELPDLPEF